ncbi:MAG: hypothetical protein LBJ83_00585 [Oscillospiraceae bacterium]|jgi:hypothetical protein|nr:hypothetical protein [Oscillospiraceae bacterium]
MEQKQNDATAPILSAAYFVSLADFRAYNFTLAGPKLKKTRNSAIRSFLLLSSVMAAYFFFVVLKSEPKMPNKQTVLLLALWIPVFLNFLFGLFGLKKWLNFSSKKVYSHDNYSLHCAKLDLFNDRLVETTKEPITMLLEEINTIWENEIAYVVSSKSNQVFIVHKTTKTIAILDQLQSMRKNKGNKI